MRNKKTIFSLVLLVTMLFSRVVSNNIVEATDKTIKDENNLKAIEESKFLLDEMNYYRHGYRKIMPWKRIKEGDFFAYAQEAIKDINGDILGWVDGVIKQDNGKYNEDGNWKSNLKIEDGYFPIIGNKDGSGSWSGILNPDSEGITYYRIAESKKYQERNSKGELMYYQEDGSKGTNVTSKRVMVDGPLNNVIYDNSTYYLKFENGRLMEMKLLFKDQIEDPFEDLKIYSKVEIKSITDRVILDDEDVIKDNNPIDYFVEYLKSQGVRGVRTEEFEKFYEYWLGENIHFENIIWPWGPEVPEVPTEPTKPEIPTEPTKPEIPTEPTKPEIPTEPTKPEIPTEPTKPEIPTEPTKPEIPTEPTKPEIPTEPTKPEIPTEPTKPEIPTEPTKPEIPTEPTKPEIPTEPTKPEIPTEPTKPEIPTEPTKPEIPTEPTKPEIPTEPTKPEIPTEPTKPEVPTESTKRKSKLPKTGIVGRFGLSISGAGLIAVGYFHIRNRKNKK